MSDDCGGDTVPGCADTGRDSYESGGGNDDSSYMDLSLNAQKSHLRKTLVTNATIMMGLLTNTM